MISSNNLWQLKSSQRIDVECTIRNNEKCTIIPQKTSKPKKKKEKTIQKNNCKKHFEF